MVVGDLVAVEWREESTEGERIHRHIGLLLSLPTVELEWDRISIFSKQVYQTDEVLTVKPLSSLEGFDLSTVDGQKKWFTL